MHILIWTKKLVELLFNYQVMNKLQQIAISRDQQHQELEIFNLLSKQTKKILKLTKLDALALLVLFTIISMVFHLAKFYAILGNGGFL